MMWNWLTQKLGRGVQVRRKKVEIDIPYEQHRYRIEDLDSKTPDNAARQQSSKFKSFN
ncbi:hypothetical protein L2719_12465 [Shewanella schlegeliana]|uniref:Uncharacterized protein n=1 Tax=Shewanella schlegeliana TaxID=190308 RepID=A0ABS1ST34_9GAMM|nr:hypothetical protein [Shewanella schlegeliana]MBL4911685.1 hypothetical protein [Shewanella schlegeliana]MCL1110363.1 hypothetical protein [Shewanella schlegeliana]GIU31255.1 hypothetical protein TUM4433_22680 [Shewanella schlegeliana]